MYFSRSPLPGGKDLEGRARSRDFSFLVHVGLYSFRRDFLLGFSNLPRSPLEELESLEQLRALENGYRIKVGVTTYEPTGVDTPEDYQRFVERYRTQMTSD